MYFEKSKRREQAGLNVTALIDVCAIIIIFLVMGTFFGDSSVAVPVGMDVPKSISKEALENAPSILITSTEVTIGFFNERSPLALFHDTNAEGLRTIKTRLKNFVAAMPAEAKKSGVLLNVIADGKTPYRDIFDVIAAFREAGFESLLFVAQGT